MAKMQVTVCDECKSLDKPTKHYRLVSEGRIANADLCATHGKPLEDMLSKLGSVTPARPRFNDTVITIEEIEARKTAKKAEGK